MNKFKLEKDMVVTLKLSSGEEIIARLDDWDDEYYYVHSPLGIGMGPKGPQMMPVLVTAMEKPDAALPRLSVNIITRSRADVEEVYTQSVTGIVAPSKQIITG